MYVHPKLNNHFKRFKHYKDNYNYKPKNILDIGALDGRWSRSMRSIFKDSNFLMIEPNHEMENFLINTNIDYIITALSNKIKKTVYYKLPGHSGNGLYQENTDNKPRAIEDVETDTLENLFDQNMKFDIIKLDVQGSEIDILEGGINLMKKSDLILTECQIIEYNIGAPFLHDQINFFKKNSFTLIDVVDLMYDKNGKLIQIDALFKNDNFNFNQK